MQRSAALPRAIADPAACGHGTAPCSTSLPCAKNLRRVEPRNTPTVVNAVFNHRNFWDGRAQAEFNGASPWGDRDPDATLYRARADGTLEPVRLRIEQASLASQALAPLVSSFEMSAEGRTIPDVGRRVVALRPLALQRVHRADSALGALSVRPFPGLRVDTHRRWIRNAFREEWWRSNARVGGYAQIEWNFGLFFGLAVQLYEATLVADQTPFDRWRAGDEGAVPDAAKRGADLAPLTARDGAEIAPLRVLDLTAAESADLVAFLRSLTDERVRHARAPFDHPQLFVPDGRALWPGERIGERLLEIPAVGRTGGAALPGFLE